MTEPRTEAGRRLLAESFDSTWMTRPIEECAAMVLAIEAEARGELDAPVAALWQWLSTLRAEHVLARGPSHGVDGEDWIGGTCAVCRGLAAFYDLKDAALARQEADRG